MLYSSFWPQRKRTSMPPHPAPTRNTVIPSAAEGSGPAFRDSSAPLRVARNDKVGETVAHSDKEEKIVARNDGMEKAAARSDVPLKSRNPRKTSGGSLRSAESAKHGWTSARRARHAAAIRRWKPWASSTGPKTAAGKAKSAQNAYKHGGRAAHTRLINQALSAQRRFVRGVLLHHRLKQYFPANELLKRLTPRLRTLDRIFHVKLHQALAMEGIMQKTCNFPAHPPNS